MAIAVVERPPNTVHVDLTQPVRSIFAGSRGPANDRCLARFRTIVVPYYSFVSQSLQPENKFENLGTRARTNPHTAVMVACAHLS